MSQSYSLITRLSCFVMRNSQLFAVPKGCLRFTLWGTLHPQINHHTVNAFKIPEDTLLAY